MQSKDVMYNFAISSICLAKIVNSKEKAIRLYEGAIKLLTLAGHFLSILYEKSEDSTLLRCVAVLLYLTLRSLAGALTVCGKGGEAAACLESATNFICIIEELLESEIYFSAVMNTTAAAAAA